MSDKMYWTAVCALISVISVLGVFLFQALSTSGTAYAETGMSAPNMLAVTGRVGSNTSVLYVIDTKKKSLAVYSAFGGKKVRFVGARRIKYDFELVSFNDTTPRKYSVNELGRQYRESTQRTSEKGGNRRRR